MSTDWLLGFLCGGIAMFVAVLVLGIWLTKRENEGRPVSQAGKDRVEKKSAEDREAEMIHEALENERKRKESLKTPPLYGERTEE